MIEEAFKTLGFKEEEAKTYLSLLDIGSASGGALSKKMGIPRPTVYGYLDRLVNGGLVTQSLKRGVKIFVPEPAERIRTLYKRKIEELNQQERKLGDIIPLLEKSSGMNLMRPRIHLFEGRDGMETALQDFLSYENILIHAFFSIRSAIDASSEDFFWYINKERLKKNTYINAIWPHNQVIDIKRYPALGSGEEFKREVRIAPEGVISSMGYWAYADKVLFCSSGTESFSFIIESAELYEMMVNQHKVIWDLSKPIDVRKEDMQPFLDDYYSDNK